jgi:uncharacterized protein YjbJ (UPF0337 family)
MSVADKVKNKAEELKGEGKEATGRATDGDELKADQAKDNLKQAGEKVKDVFKSDRPAPRAHPHSGAPIRV